nr:MAG TPA: hypothetical protein [Microviridae sp.]
MAFSFVYPVPFCKSVVSLSNKAFAVNIPSLNRT